MCQMSVVLDKGDEQQTVLENVTLLEVKDGGVEVSSLFDAPMMVADCQVQRIDFNSNTVTLVPR